MSKDDNQLMAFGKHKGEPIGTVPASYLLFLYENDRAGRHKKYIEDNWEVLNQEIGDSLNEPF